jgi:hypothetical protein
LIRKDMLSFPVVAVVWADPISWTAPMTSDECEICYITLLKCS